MAHPTPTAAEIETALRDRIARAEILLQIAGIVRETARKMEGRKADKRFANAVKARVEEVMGEGWAVHWDADDWRRNVVIWGNRNMPNAPQWGDRASFAVARPDSASMVRNPIDTVSEAWIVEENQCYFLEAERLPRVRAALDAGKPAEWAAKAAEIAAMRKALREDMAAHEAAYAAYTVKLD